MSRIGAVTLLVRDYDEAIEFYVGALGFDLIEDTMLGAPQDDDAGAGDAPTDDAPKRWVRVGPAGDAGAALVLARGDTEAQVARIGDQTGGRVSLFLHTDDFGRDHERMLAAGVRFLEAPRHESYGSVAVFADLYGNRWDLIGTTEPSDATDDADRPTSGS